MKIIFVLLSVLSLIVYSKEIKNIEVLDGDTIAYTDNGKRMRVRLYGIDAPELDQQYGLEAKTKLKKLLKRKVELIVLSSDIYRREVGLIYVNKTCINSTMILEGCAWYYPDSKPVCNLYKKHEEHARLKQIGMWENPINIEPWKFRKENK